MSDYISRQDAIEAIANLTCFGIEEIKVQCEASVADSEGWLGSIRDAVIELEDLPSAEPEFEEFEWCHDCKEYDQEKHCCHRWTKVIRQSVDEVKNSQWIPVTEALPNNAEYDWVLGQIREKDSGYLWIPRQVEYRESRDDWYEESIGWFKENSDFEVIAWMPLPERYQGK